MFQKGYLLCFIDSYDHEYQPITSIAFSLDKEELEKELEKLTKAASDQLKEFNSQSSNFDKYIYTFNKAWSKFEQKNVIPKYTPGITQTIEQPRTKEEHAEYKRIKDFNTENGRQNRNLYISEKSKFLVSWMKSNPPHESFAKFVEVMNAGLLKSSFKLDSISYFISSSYSPFKIL